MLTARRLKELPPYLFIQIDKKKKELLKKGVDIISFGVGDPDLPTPEHIVKSGQKALENPAFHQYPFGPGMETFRRAVAGWYKKRFAVQLDIDKEIHSLIGSKEGIGHMPLAFVNPGDYVLIPEPGYPVYMASTIFAGGKPYQIPLLKENNFLPDFKKIPKTVLNKTKIMFLNYPNNPTSAVATREFFKQVVEFAGKYDIIVAHDAAYSEIYYSEPPLSFLSVPGAKETGVELHSLSKTYNMTGWRIAWVCGNSEIIKGISTVKDNYDSGVFNAVQQAGVTALTGPQDCVQRMREIYKERRDILCEGLKDSGWNMNIPPATFYVWVHCPGKWTSTKTAEILIEKAGVVVTPGVGMGPSGEGYIRFSLTVDKERIREAVERIKKIKW
ncbi:MAG: LL-diaminopimelate aminotransferase [Elusimicrobia bacterium CG1_02_37_114]|nr:MAG: LL-diaminopimelate aminotransferase [Elusimicrobia bacterium CG1_02_37_114]PIV53030.1 MAG: LL-diaminopimelate aminotransferase [Elusimicrobia bacterium CG02_land_8_20_14_3_00_37_13]PIZ13970.1 MAG: LL-diaminopimelate aminotransferase [Elusimicrobia bacterium CG_4_10_14_0_8_um_filter_37_32]